MRGDSRKKNGTTGKRGGVVSGAGETAPSGAGAQSSAFGRGRGRAKTIPNGTTAGSPEKAGAVRKSSTGKTAHAKVADAKAASAAEGKKAETLQQDSVFLTELDRYLFGEGTHYQIYKKMGAHEAEVNGTRGMHFAVWAPHAEAVSLICDRNGWDVNADMLHPLADSGIFEGFKAGMGEGELYKYAIHTKDGKILYKADPYAFAAEYRPGTASITASIDGYRWNDGRWMAQRAAADVQRRPLAIYECHIASWKKVDRPERDGCMTYQEAAHALAGYCKDMGYTHVELMGIAEHPFDGSWGYQVTGYYAPTSRYGGPKDFMYMVDYLHQNGIGVILDWVPAHFPKDAHGLAMFDGTPTYEYADSRKGEHPDWGTKVFDYTKHEVTDFLIANALYWLNEYHVDGLRVDAVASMLYLDYGRTAGNWCPNIHGGNENLEAIEFFKHLNSVIAGRKDGSMIIAEESTAWPKVTARPEDGGLGFTFKWNMGWMHDFLDYMKLDPYFRKFNHNKMTFGMSYATSEKFILVLSHDEVVHLKCSMINKMPGTMEEKFANLKCGYFFMFGHAGKKLLFMGQDFGQLHEWNEAVALDWQLCEEEPHQKLKDFVHDLLHLYKENPAMYELDDSWDGFEWINANDGDRSIFSFVRKDISGKKNLLFVVNMTPVARPDYRVGVPKKGHYTLVFNENGAVKSGRTGHRPAGIQAEHKPCDGKEFSIPYALPAFGCAVFKF